MIQGPGGTVPLPLNTGDDLGDLGSLVPVLAGSGAEAVEQEEVNSPDPIPQIGEAHPGIENPNGEPHKSVSKAWEGKDTEGKLESFLSELEALGGDALQGVRIYFQEGPPSLVLIDLADWFEGSIEQEKQIGRLAANLVGDEARVVWQNEGAKPVAPWQQIVNEGISRQEKSLASVVTKQDGPHDYSCVMAEVPEDLKSAIVAYAKRIIPEDILAEDGYELDSHITIKYGLHTSNPKEVEELLKQSRPFKIELGEITLFPAEETSRQFDVVKVDILSPGCVELNKLICSELAYTDKHPVYKPHLTLAYVKPGSLK
jgi:hypothetical protein